MAAKKGGNLELATGDLAYVRMLGSRMFVAAAWHRRVYRVMA
jgi:hypothetical protein